MAYRFPIQRLRALQTIPVLVLLLLPGPLAGAGPGEPEHVPRTIIALIDGGPDGFENDRVDDVQQVYEFPLNHLGMTVYRHDVRKGPPPAAWLGDLRAVLTCFQYSEEPVDWLWPWIEKRAREGTRIVIVNEFGPLLEVAPDGTGTQRLAAFFQRVGLGFDDVYVKLPLGVEKELRSRELAAYEADPTGCNVHRGPFLGRGESKAWVTTRCPIEDPRARVPVVTGPWGGGLALLLWVYRETEVEGARRWYLDLFAFFREALGLEGVPAPHPSVVNGRRMFFCHVDGDGFESLSTARTGKLCGEVFLPAIIEKFELPFTVSIIVASLTPHIDPAEPTRAMKAASRLLMHPRVEAATHMVLHPFDWSYRKGAKFPVSAAFDGLGGYESTPAAEVRESVRFIDEKLLTGGKRCRVILWSGDCTPPAPAIHESDRLGCVNLNGGEYRWDPLYDTVSYVAPWGRHLDGTIQAYCGAPNENIYEGYFTTQPASYWQVDTIIERTGRGRILKPANVYVHFYSVEHPTRLAVFVRLLRKWGEQADLAPVFASTYAAAVRDAMRGGRLERTAGGWRFLDFGECRTVRFDGATERIDWDRSPGILGARRIGESLYLHLAGGDAEVAFARDAPERVHLVEANHVLTEAGRSTKRIAVTSSSVAPRVLVFGGLPPGEEVRLTIDGDAGTRPATENGTLRVELAPGTCRIEVEVP